MKSDLDALMEAKQLDALLVIGDAQHNPPMVYLTGGGHVTGASLIKKRGEAGVLYCNDMEREEAAKSGLKVLSYNAYNYEALLKEAHGDAALASAIRYKRMFTDHRLHGRVGLYGSTDLGSAFAIFTQLQELLPEVELVGEVRDDSVFL